MRATDLGQLYALLETYGMTYGGVGAGLLEEVQEAYQEAKAAGFGEDSSYTIRNPRGAGRKNGVTQEKIQQATELRSQGYRLREIGEEMGCSASHVLKLIQEQKPNRETTGKR